MLIDYSATRTFTQTLQIDDIGNCPLYTAVLSDAFMPTIGTGRCIRTTGRHTWT